VTVAVEGQHTGRTKPWRQVWRMLLFQLRTSRQLHIPKLNKSSL
jgi:hypothetical protein